MDSSDASREVKFNQYEPLPTARWFVPVLAQQSGKSTVAEGWKACGHGRKEMQEIEAECCRAIHDPEQAQDRHTPE